METRTPAKQPRLRIGTSVMLPPDLRARLHDISWATGRSMSRVVEEAVAEYVEARYQQAMAEKLRAVAAPEGDPRLYTPAQIEEFLQDDLDPAVRAKIEGILAED